MISNKERNLIWSKTQELEVLYPIEAFGSKASLWSEGLRDDVVDINLYNKAREYYGRLWTYAGD